MNKAKLYLSIAQTVSKAGTCPKMEVGAVLVKNGRIISLGYNGAPRGVAHCDLVGCDKENNHCRRAVHAELNAILNAAFVGSSTDGAEMFSTHSPCQTCTKALINAGIKKVTFELEYVDDIAYQLAKEGNLERVRMAI